MENFIRPCYLLVLHFWDAQESDEGGIEEPNEEEEPKYASQHTALFWLLRALLRYILYRQSVVSHRRGNNRLQRAVFQPLASQCRRTPERGVLCSIRGQGEKRELYVKQDDSSEETTIVSVRQVSRVEMVK